MRKEIKKLELAKLFKEFSFLKIDEEYKLELQNTYGLEFSLALQDLFKKNPDLDLLYNNNKPNISTPTTAENQPEEQKTIDSTLFIPGPGELGQDNSIQLYSKKDTANIIKEPDKSPEVKRLYRKIATKTHPDKVAVKFLNDIYLKAKTAYQANDLFTLYLLCSEINIDFDFPVEELKNFKTHIKDLKNRNGFMEQTFLWAWIHEENEDIRRNILIQYLIQLQKIRI